MPKNRKSNMPLRSIASKCSRPTCILEKAYVHFLKYILQDSELTIKSTEDFIQKIKHIQIPDNYIRASLDIVSLFPLIDAQEV